MILPYLLFVVLIQESFEESINDEEISSDFKKLFATREFKPLNVIIFLASPDEYNKNFTDGHYNDSGLNFLNFPLHTTVKCCSQVVSNNQPDISLSSGCNCEYRLKRNLRNLIDWVEQKQQMITAFLSTSDTPTEIIRQYNLVNPNNNLDFTHYRHETKLINNNRYPFHRDPFQLVRDKDIFQQLPLKPHEQSYERTYLNDEYMPSLKQWKIFDTDNIPIYNVYNPDYKNKYIKHPKSAEKNKINNVPTIIHFLKPKGRNVYKLPENTKWDYLIHKSRPSVRVKRSLMSTDEEFESNPNVEYSDVNNFQFNEDTWAGFGLFEKLRNTFLESFFNPSIKREMENFEENSVNLDMLGKIEELSYSDLVRSTIQKLQKETKRNAELHQNKNHGYMLIVRAGNLSDVADPHSELVQTVKSIRENTGAETLVVVSGSCPNKNSHLAKVPLYVSGSCYKKLDDSTSTSNMFEKIRLCLMEPPLAFDEILNNVQTESDINSVDYKKTYAEYLQELMNGNVLVAKERYSRFSTALANRTNLICYLMAILTAFLFFHN